MNKTQPRKKQGAGLLYIESIRFIRLYRWIFLLLTALFCFLAYNRHEEGKSIVEGMEAQEGMSYGLPGETEFDTATLNYSTILEENEDGQLVISTIKDLENFNSYTSQQISAAYTAEDYKLYHQLSILNQLIQTRAYMPVYDIDRFNEWAEPYFEVALDGLPEIAFELEMGAMGTGFFSDDMAQIILDYQVGLAKTNSDWMHPKDGGPIPFLEDVFRGWGVILMIALALVFTFDTINRDLNDKNVFHSLVGAKSRSSYYLSKLGLNFGKCLLAFFVPLLIGLVVSLVLDGPNNLEAPVLVQKGTLNEMEGYTYADLAFARFRYDPFYIGITETDFRLSIPSPELGHAYISLLAENYEFIPYYLYLMAEIGLLLSLTLFYVAFFQWISLEISESYMSLIVCMLAAIAFPLIGRFVFDQTMQMHLSTGVLNLPESVALGNNVSYLYALLNSFGIVVLAILLGIFRFFRRDL